MIWNLGVKRIIQRMMIPNLNDDFSNHRALRVIPLAPFSKAGLIDSVLNVQHRTNQPCLQRGRPRTLPQNWLLCLTRNPHKVNRSMPVHQTRNHKRRTSCQRADHHHFQRACNYRLTGNFAFKITEYKQTN